jgi:hypothetical protein
VIVYKIRNKNNSEQFLLGTPTYNSWDKTGRMFQTIGKLRTFLTNSLKSQRTSKNIGDWEVVEYELAEQSTKNVHEMFDAKKIMELLRK